MEGEFKEIVELRWNEEVSHSYNAYEMHGGERHPQSTYSDNQV
jgi:hypothetical protein